MTTSPPRQPIVHLITFGGGSIDFHEAAERVKRQALEFPDIDTATAYTDLNLPSDFTERFGDFCRAYPKGYGLWIWKPYLILLALNELNENDILVYVDSGCELNKYGSTRFNDYLSYTAKNDVLLFELTHQNRRWTKSHPLLTGDREHHFRNQLAGSGLFFKKTRHNLELVQAWLDLCCEDNFSAMKDPEQDEPQIPEFIAHRHDQSCLSAVAYRFGVNTRPDETWFRSWRAAGTYPVLTFRNRTGRSKLSKVFRFKGLKEKLGLLRW